ncbi:hypothetical protein [Caulobacter sp. NIBR1757]|uniref:hypothetical protein n=1 Tax=Caulobacter sp. NIBR1757 TaxID=3016000 RepID=UPI0022F11DA8|nr:hypothetical protein [Caulobacter sp. NIBR1757]WGM37153.1 hypothetical protein AMEJIAPC_00047 [Caulobacter sp. NIBR1757]
MVFRSILPALAVAVLAIAGQAAAQTRLSPPNGLGSVLLPTGIERHPLGGDTDETLSFIVRRPGQTGLDWAGLCMVSISRPAKPPTVESWTTVAAIYYANAEQKARERVSGKGGTFDRMLTNKPWTSKTGWAGWFTAYQATTKDGVSESSVFGGTQLAIDIRVVLNCTSSQGQSFTPADLAVIEKLSQSVSN